jgi:hypothetical protein
MARNTRESDIQMALCKYVRLKYPQALFNVDLSGINLSKTSSGKAKMMRSSKGFPDFVLYQMVPNRKTGTGDNISILGALFIELKAEGTRLIAADGMKCTSTHIAEQLEMIDKLKSKGYEAVMCIGLDEAMKAVDEYMSRQSHRIKRKNG